MKKILLALALALCSSWVRADTALTLYDSTTHFMQIRPAHVMGQNYYLVFPTTAPTAGKVLGVTNVSGSSVTLNFVTSASGGGGTWGTITGTLSNQTDLQTALNAIGVSTAVLSVSTASLQTQITGLGSTYLTLSSATATYLQTSSATATYLQLSSATATYLQPASISATQPILYNSATKVFSSTLISATTGMMGTLQAAQEPAHTGDVTNTAGSLAMTAAAQQSNIKTFTSSITVANTAGLNLTGPIIGTIFTFISGGNYASQITSNTILGSATVYADGLIRGSNLTGSASGSNTGDQTITLTGDVTGAGTGSFATTLASVVTANQYGSATVSPVITFDAKGRITAVSSATIAGGAGSGIVSPGTFTWQNTQGMTVSTFTASALVQFTSNTVLGSGTTFYQDGTINVSNLSASLPVQTDSNKRLVSSAIDVSGSQATGVLAAGRFPALTGDITTSAASLATTAAAQQGNIKTFTSSITITNAAGLNVATQIIASSATLVNVYVSSNSILANTTFYRDGTAIMGPTTVAASDTDYALRISSANAEPRFSFLFNGSIVSSGTVPVLSSCGSSPSLSTGSDNFAGTITAGSTSTGCTLTFASGGFTNTPTCVISNQSMSVANALTYTVSTTALTLSETGLGTSKIDYICIGH